MGGNPCPTLSALAGTSDWIVRRPRIGWNIKGKEQVKKLQKLRLPNLCCAMLGFQGRAISWTCVINGPFYLGYKI